MNNEESIDIVIEAIEVIMNHILYARKIYPQKIFKIRRFYNVPIFVSIFPQLNNYLCKVLTAARKLYSNRNLLEVELILFCNDNEIYERYRLKVNTIGSKHLNKNDESDFNFDDDFLLEFENQLKISIHKLSEHIKVLKKLPNDIKFKVLLHTTHAVFARLSSNTDYKDFPWLQDLPIKKKENSAILPLAKMDFIGLEFLAEINCK